MIEFRWVDLALLVLSILIGVLVIVPRPESKSPLILIDDAAGYYACLERGCWNRARVQISFADLAAFTKTDEKQLRAGNPQVHGDIVHAGDEIRISHAMAAPKSDH